MTSLGVPGMCELIKKVQNSNNDMIIAVTGYRGAGKSTLIIQAAAKLMGKICLSKADFEQHFIYSRKELDEKLEKFEKQRVICVDESINLLFRREFQNKQQNQIIKKFNTYRDKQYCIFLVIPTFWQLDSAVRNSLIIKWWVHCVDRGNAIIYQPEDNEWNYDPWNQKENFIDRRMKKPIYKSKNYFSNIVWQKLPEELEQEYNEIKAKKRKESYADEEKKIKVELTKRQVVEGMINNNPGLTVTQIAGILHMDKGYVSTILNSDNVVVADANI